MTQFQVTAEPRVSEFDDGYDDERQIRGAIFGEPLSKVPRRPLVTVPVTATIGKAISAMNDKHVGCALIVRKGKLAGIFTERDVLQKVLGKAIPLELSVEKAMTPNPVTLPDSASIAYALRHMSQEGYRHVPLVDAAGSPIGVVAVRDIVSWVCNLFPAALLNIPPTPAVAQSVDGG